MAFCTKPTSSSSSTAIPPPTSSARDEVADPRSRPPSGSSFYYTIDMGAQVPVERFVFYPPEGVSPDSDPALSSQLCPQIIQPDSPPETREV